MNRLKSAANTIVIKRYHTADRQLALRANGNLYYTLSDPTGASLTLTDEQGNASGRILYDGYGGVLSSTVPVTLTASVGGGMPDADTGLVYLGGGRFYDPSTGRPLQPNPVSGPPTVPQALNRYGATSAGQVGVAQTVESSLGGLATAYSWFSVAKGAGLEGAGLLPVLNGYKYIGQAEITVQASRSALARKIPKAFKAAFGDLASTSESSIYKRTGQLIVGGSTEQELKLAVRQLEGFFIDALPSQGKWKANILISEVMVADRLPQYVKLGKLSGFKVLKFGLGPALDVGVGGYLQYLEDRDNPYLTGRQKGLRVITSGVGSAGTALLIGEGLIALGCSATVVCGITAGVTGVIIWGIAQPIIFDFPIFASADRNLRPLQVP